MEQLELGKVVGFVEERPTHKITGTLVRVPADHEVLEAFQE